MTAARGPGSCRILVVDDEDSARRSLAEIVRLEGFQVDTAEDGNQAIGLFLQHHIANSSYDLIILDLKMPGTDGLDVLHFITHTIPNPTDIRRPTVILLTAHGSLESAIEALRCGAHDYLLKPASPDQIIRSIFRALELGGQQKQQAEVSIGLQASHVSPEKPSYAILGNGIYFYPIRRELTLKESEGEDRVVRLTPTEAKLLIVFLENQSQVLSHRKLVGLVQGYDIKAWEAAEVLRPLISRLRRKLAQFPGGKDWIINIRGTGYLFEHHAE